MNPNNIFLHLLGYFLTIVVILLSYYGIYKLVLPRSKIFKWFFEEPKDKLRKKNKNKWNH